MRELAADAPVLSFHGRYAEALKYVEQSERAFDQLPGKALDLARLALVKASALRMQNRSEEALELTRQAARTYRRYNDRPRYVQRDLAEALVANEEPDQVPMICHEVIAHLADAGLAMQAIPALSLLREAAAMGRASRALVRHTHATVKRVGRVEVGVFAKGRRDMRNDFLQSDEHRLWLFERLLPIVLVFVVPVALGLNHWLRESETRKREELVAMLNGLSPRYSVTIDFRDAIDPAAVVEALKTIKEERHHHSSPTRPRLVQLRSEGKVIQLCLERDSDRPTEYWVSTLRKGGCGEVAFGNPYFGMLSTNRLASYWGGLDRVR